MASRWDEGQVLALAPDASGAAAGQKVARADAAWVEAAAHGPALWGRCAGSGSSAYRVVVDLSGPASRCSCPSRKFPCKHALGLLLRWAGGAVADVDGPPEDVLEWLAARQARTDRSTRPAGVPTGAAHGGEAVSTARTARREQRVSAGLDEVERWLHDQLRAGLAAARADGAAESARVAARLVDAQAPGVAGMVRELPWHSGGDRWPDRVLQEMARVSLLVAGYRAGPGTPVDREVLRSRVGWSTATEDVLARAGTTDRWLVLWQADEPDGRLVARRAHLHGTTTGTDLLVLAFGAGGQAPDTGLVPGTVLDADVHTHPGRPLRGVVGERRGAAGPPDGDRAVGVGVQVAVDRLADAVARDPWVREVPLVLGAVRPARQDGRWAVLDPDGQSLPLLGDGVPAEWLAASGGLAADVAGELTSSGFRLRAVLTGADGP